MANPDAAEAHNDFFRCYAEALTAYLRTRDEAGLAVGHDLGRRALRERMSLLGIVEHHVRLAGEAAEAALPFLLQTLAALDVAARGFLDGTTRYEQQRARADDLAGRDEFRSALVNSLQEGFFVADRTGAIVEINDAFTQITGYGAEGLPYRMPHPWVPDQAAANARLAALVRDDTVAAETLIRHRDGPERWVAVSINAVRTPGSEHDAYVGTIRDITAQHAAAQRERAVVRLTTAVSMARSVEEVLSSTLGECSNTLDARRVMAVVWSPNDVDPRVFTAGEPAVSEWHDLDPDWRRTVEDARGWLPLTVTPVGAAPSAGTTRGFVAMLSGGRDIVMCLEHRVPRKVTSEDRHLIGALVGHLSLAMQHVRQFQTARETSLTLQRSMLAPSALPPGCVVRYEPAVSPLEIGGDFYDVLPLGDHRVGLVVGDCVGRGLSAAAVMGQLRASARALLLAGAEPARVLEQLDAVTELIPDAYCSTVFVAIVDAEAGTVCYSSAGHLPPVLAADASQADLLTDGRSVPLGVQGDGPRPQSARPMPVGATLMLYTDGLVERRDETIDDQISQLVAVVTDTGQLPVEAVADAVLNRLAPEGGYDDDVALVLFRRTPAALVIDIDADAHRLTEVRHRLAAWLRNRSIPEERIADIVLVVNEACSNCVEHAYRDRVRGSMRVEAERCGGEVRICVSDSGSWKTPPADPGTRGRGLPLIRAMSDRVAVDGTAEGTTIAITFRLLDTRNEPA